MDNIVLVVPVAKVNSTCGLVGSRCELQQPSQLRRDPTYQGTGRISRSGHSIDNPAQHLELKP
jgi:hypothetical protein